MYYPVRCVLFRQLCVTWVSCVVLGQLHDNSVSCALLSQLRITRSVVYHSIGCMITLSVVYYSVSCVTLSYTSVNSSCAHPPRATAGDLCALSVPGWGISKFGAARGSSFCLPGATLGLLMRTWFPTRNPNMEDFIPNDQQFVADWLVCLGLDKLVEAFSILCISSLLIRAQLELSLSIARSGTINVNRHTHASLIKDLNKS